MNNQELIEFDIETQRLQNEVNKHLSKFQDLDLLFKDAKLVIQKYFEEQDIYKDIYVFIQYLKEEVIFYVNSFNLTRNERKNIRKRLDYIEETYSNLIYFGEEINPIEALKQRLKEDEMDLKPKTKGIISGMKDVLGKIIK